VSGLAQDANTCVTLCETPWRCVTRRGSVCSVGRSPRINEPGLTFHVWANGTSGAVLFRDAIDKDVALRMLQEEVALSNWTCLAYVIMSTHYHLLLRLNDATLSSGFLRLNLRYARYYNRRYSLRGHVFDGRFESELVEGPTGELEVARYIALNPTRAAMCRLPEDYPWSAFGSIVGLYPPDPVIDLRAALAPVGGSRAAYRAFVEALDPRLRRGKARPKRVTPTRRR
jgi:REP-associated tyrosine transposase